jgi:predicted SnoaL-like aldol condensation-catalyzing enzyme
MAHNGKGHTKEDSHGRPRDQQGDCARLLQHGVQRQEARRGGREVRRSTLHPAQPQIPDGFEAFVQFVEGFTTQFPQLSVEFYRTAADGDLVVTHSLLKTSPADRGGAAADFFRLEDGKLVEHWDVIQPVPESAANEHPMF